MRKRSTCSCPRTFLPKSFSLPFLFWGPAVPDHNTAHSAGNQPCRLGEEPSEAVFPRACQLSRSFKQETFLHRSSAEWQHLWHSDKCFSIYLLWNTCFSSAPSLFLTDTARGIVLNAPTPLSLGLRMGSPRSPTGSYSHGPYSSPSLPHRQSAQGHAEPGKQLGCLAFSPGKVFSRLLAGTPSQVPHHCTRSVSDSTTAWWSGREHRTVKNENPGPLKRFSLFQGVRVLLFLWGQTTVKIVGLDVYTLYSKKRKFFTYTPRTGTQFKKVTLVTCSTQGPWMSCLCPRA